VPQLPAALSGTLTDCLLAVADRGESVWRQTSAFLFASVGSSYDMPFAISASRPCNCSGGQTPASHHRDPGFNPGEVKVEFVVYTVGYRYEEWCLLGCYAVWPL
jgi:hypothetical protein